MIKLKNKMSLTLTCLLLNIASMAFSQNGAKNEKLSPMTEEAKAELRIKYQKLINESDLVVEAKFDGEYETHLNCSAEDYKNKNFNNPNDEHAVRSNALKVLHVYKGDRQDVSKSISVIEQGDFVQYINNEAGITLSGAHAHEQAIIESTGRYLLFLKHQSISSPYKVKHKDLSSYTLNGAVLYGDEVNGVKSDINSCFIYIATPENKRTSSYHKTAIVFPTKKEQDEYRINTIWKYRFISENDFIEFMNTFQSLNKKEFVQLKSTEKSDKNLISEQEQEKLNTIKKTEIDNINQSFKKRCVNCNGKKSIADEKSGNKSSVVGTLTYGIQNQTLINFAGSKYLEFEVTAKATGIANSYLSLSNLTLQYNTSAFGSNIAAASNVNLILGSAFNSSIYSVQSIDQASNAIQLNIANNSLSNLGTLMTANTSIVLYKVQMKVLPNLGSNCTSGLVYTNQANTSSFTFYSIPPSAANVYNYSSISYDAISPITLCTQVTINQLPTTSFVAGIGQVLTITGSGFGTTPRTLQFTNANTGGVETINNPNNPNANEYKFTGAVKPYNIISWTNAQIQVVVPSLVALNYTNASLPYANEGVAATGPIKITNIFGDFAISNSNLNIGYSVTNDFNFDASNNEITPLQLLTAKTNCDNGYVFYLGTDFKTAPYSAAVPAIEKALLEWRTFIRNNVSGLSNFELKLARDGANKLIYTVDNGGINIITTNPNSSIVRAKIFTLTQKYPTANPASEVSLKKGYIEVGKLATWDFSLTGNIAPNSKDFLANISHELGHILGIDHLIGNSTTNTMIGNSAGYYGNKHLMYAIELVSSNATLNSSDRVSVNQNGTEANSAVQNILTTSKNFTINNPEFRTIGSSNTPAIKLFGPSPVLLNTSITLCPGVGKTFNTNSFTGTIWKRNGVAFNPGSNTQFASLSYPLTASSFVNYTAELNCSSTLPNISPTVTIIKNNDPNCSTNLGGGGPPPPNKMAQSNTATSSTTFENEILVYPNPTKDVINLMGLEDRPYEYRLINSIGAMVKFGTVDLQNNKIDLSVPGVSGLYVLIINDKITGSIQKTNISLDK